MFGSSEGSEAERSAAAAASPARGAFRVLAPPSSSTSSAFYATQSRLPGSVPRSHPSDLASTLPSPPPGPATATATFGANPRTFRPHTTTTAASTRAMPKPQAIGFASPPSVLMRKTRESSYSATPNTFGSSAARCPPTPEGRTPQPFGHFSSAAGPSGGFGFQSSRAPTQAGSVNQGAGSSLFQRRRDSDESPTFGMSASQSVRETSFSTPPIGGQFVRTLASFSANPSNLTPPQYLFVSPFARKNADQNRFVPDTPPQHEAKRTRMLSHSSSSGALAAQGGSSHISPRVGSGNLNHSGSRSLSGGAALTPRAAPPSVLDSAEDDERCLGEAFNEPSSLARHSSLSMDVLRTRSVTPTGEDGDDLPLDTAPSLDFLGELGQGEFGVVTKVRVRGSSGNRIYALKRSKHVSRNKVPLSAVRECQLWERVASCERLVPIHRAWYDGEHFYMLMKWCEDGPLSALYRDTRLLESELWSALRDVATGLAAIHKEGLVHTDVKPANMYLSRGRVYLGDYGHMCRIGDPRADHGDHSYVSGECFHNPDHIPATSDDIFSLGISFYELAADIQLPSTGPAWAELRESGPLRLVEEQHEDTMLSSAMFDEIARMMHNDPQMRPSAREIMEMDLVKSSPPTIPLVNLRQVQSQQRMTPMTPRRLAELGRPASAVFGANFAYRTASAAGMSEGPGYSPRASSLISDDLVAFPPASFAPMPTKPLRRASSISSFGGLGGAAQASQAPSSATSPMLGFPGGGSMLPPPSPSHQSPFVQDERVGTRRRLPTLESCTPQRPSSSAPSYPVFGDGAPAASSSHHELDRLPDVFMASAVVTPRASTTPTLLGGSEASTPRGSSLQHQHVGAGRYTVSSSLSRTASPAPGSTSGTSPRASGAVSPLTLGLRGSSSHQRG